MQHNRRLRAGEGVFYFLGGVLLKTDDTHVHFMYIEAAKVGNLQDAEREDEHFPKRVADFLKEVRLPDQRPRINVCDRFDMWSTDLTHHLYSSNNTHHLYTKRS